ncbi:alpha/beta fold hydrolase [Streptomyces sp. NPDC088115]|uniref:alpha/beta fold hydrolase n=1 Tax=Streptomyces sp. NPDC088115 TaxID=3365824 RepID=UPI0037FA657E
MLSRPGRVPVVLLHALSMNASMWDAQRAALEERGHRVLAPHQRGFGGAPLGVEPPSLDVVADDVARLLDEHGIRRAAIVGSSMGGYVAMAFLRRHPGRALGLGLLSCRATADDDRARADRERFASGMEEAQTARQLIEATTPMLVGSTTRTQRPGVLARVRALAAEADPPSLAWAQRAIAARVDSTDVLRFTRVPAVVVAGAQDPLVSPQESLDTARLLPGGELVTVPGTGHLQPVESPGPVTDILIALLDRLDTAERREADAC